MLSNHRRIVVGLVLAGVLVAAAMANAHIREPGIGWFIAGHTKKDGKVEDPINVIFMGNQIAVDNDKIDEMLHKWAGGHRGEMKHRWCNADDETLKYRHPPVFDQTENIEKSTGGHCGSQYHARVWNSENHDVHYFNSFYHINRPYWGWAAVAVHKEKHSIAGHGIRPPPCATHCVNQDFDRTSQVMRKELDVYCSWGNWRRLPGSGPRYFDQNSEGSFWSNGKVDRISPERKDAPGKCQGDP